MDSTKWFWAYVMIKRGEKNYTEELAEANSLDFHYMQALVNALYPNSLPKGSGKFDRLLTYAREVSEEADWIRRNFIGRDPELEAFFAGVIATISAYNREIEKIKKGH